MQINELIKIWKDHNISICIMEFNCGGDSMNDYNFKFYDENNEEIICSELENYFQNSVFDNVTFYEASDGHYQGEFGTVEITLNEDESDFYYDKYSKSEFNESITNDIYIDLTKEELDFVNDYVLNINGGNDTDDMVVNYKKDFILTDKLAEIKKNIKLKINNVTSNYIPDNIEEEINDYYNFTTNNIEIINYQLKIEITNSYTSIVESD